MDSPTIPSDAPAVAKRRQRVPWWLWVLALSLLAINVYKQRPPTLSEAERKELEVGTKVIPPDGGPEIAFAKLAIAQKGKKILTTDVGEVVVMQLDQLTAQSDFVQDQFRAALFFGRLGNHSVMVDRFKLLKDKIDPSSPLHQDMETARMILTPGGSDTRPAGEAMAKFIERHGWFARIALDDGAPGGLYDQARRDGDKLARVGVRYLGLQAVICVIGIGVIILLWILSLTGRFRRFPTDWKSVPTNDHGAGPGRAVWLEAVAVFLAGFLLIKVAGWGAATLGVPEHVLVWMSLLLPWLLVPMILWPFYRGMSWRMFSQGIGWHRGRGVLREIGTGVICYTALVPTIMAIMLLLLLISSLLGLKPPQVANRAFELGSGTGWQLVATFALVTLWAPLLEEAVFRGSLYRFVRGRAWIVMAVGTTALTFAIMHSYAPAQLVAVGTMGVGFALLREWRGSLLASMTGHFLQNALAFTFISQIAPIMQG